MAHSHPAAGGDVAEQLLNTLDDLLTRQPVQPSHAHAEAVAAAVDTAVHDHPLLHAHAATVVDHWRAAAER